MALRERKIGRCSRETRAAIECVSARYECCGAVVPEILPLQADALDGVQQCAEPERRMNVWVTDCSTVPERMQSANRIHLECKVAITAVRCVGPVRVPSKGDRVRGRERSRRSVQQRSGTLRRDTVGSNSRMMAARSADNVGAPFPSLALQLRY